MIYGRMTGTKEDEDGTIWVTFRLRREDNTDTNELRLFLACLASDLGLEFSDGRPSVVLRPAEIPTKGKKK